MFLDYGLLRMALTSKLTSSFVILLVLSLTLPLMHLGYAQTPSSVNFSSKGTVAESSNFHGVVMWTIVHGDKGTILLQSPVGRGLVHVSISPSTTCDSTVPICLLSTVIDTTDNDVFKVGDTARYSIDLNAKQETVSLLTGVLAGFDVAVNLSKTWNKTPAISSTTTTSTNSTTIANPASVYCVNHGGKLDIRTTSSGQTGICVFSNGYECDEWNYFKGECSPVTMSGGVNSTMSSNINSTAITNSTAPKNFTLNLNESVGITAKG
ncbi:hypothetical protein DYY66_1346 [Candidatus Nitrosotalea sp. FS]|nr:hypothetical protein [Candidatus Nitrosotalea sp. FS]